MPNSNCFLCKFYSQTSFRQSAPQQYPAHSIVIVSRFLAMPFQVLKLSTGDQSRVGCLFIHHWNFSIQVVTLTETEKTMSTSELRTHLIDRARGKLPAAFHQKQV